MVTNSSGLFQSDCASLGLGDRVIPSLEAYPSTLMCTCNAQRAIRKCILFKMPVQTNYQVIKRLSDTVMTIVGEMDSIIPISTQK